MASISSVKEDEFIQSLVGDTENKIWIGGKRNCQVSYVNQFPMISCDDFSWSDGTSWTFNKMTPLPVPVVGVGSQSPPFIPGEHGLDLRNSGGFGKRSPQTRTLPSVSVFEYDECVLWGKNGWEPTKCDEEEKNFICKYW